MKPVLLWIGIVLLPFAACGVRRGDVVLVPKSYEGWVQIHYDVGGAPVLRQEEEANLVEVPGSGIVTTSSSRSPGYGSDRYFFVDEAGSRTPIPVDGDEEDGRSVSNFQYFSSPAQVTVFFVGEPTKVEQYKRPVAEDF